MFVLIVTYSKRVPPPQWPGASADSPLDTGAGGSLESAPDDAPAPEEPPAPAAPPAGPPAPDPPGRADKPDCRRVLLPPAGRANQH